MAQPPDQDEGGKTLYELPERRVRRSMTSVHARHIASLRRAAVVVALIVCGLAAKAQPPSADWRTIETAHFRVHYPRAYEAWTQRVTSRLESIREAVARETGFAAAPTTDIIVMNPEASANGLTLPLLDTPRIVLYAEQPSPDEQIGEYGEWTDLLVTHEMTHLEHLMRPSRNALQRIVEALLPLGPMTISSPRWAMEGYATMVEGRLTGSGRPSSTIRAVILRKWAATGQLPTYAQLSSDQRFLGMSMAYLAGSAYLEWLEQRAGTGSLRKLWARMTAKRRRSFDEAFEGVFGDTPARLYGRFAAELTERAVNVDRAAAADLREGELWQDTSRDSGDPAVSPDGKHLAFVARDRNHRARLVVVSTAAPVEEEKRWQERIAAIIRRDPEDVAAVRSKPLPRKPEHELELPLGGDISTPRWLPGGGAILFGHRARDRFGDRHHELYVWTLDRGAATRVTYSGDVFDADPLDDGRRAVAVRSRFGTSQLVVVDLQSGKVDALTEPSLDRVYSHPRHHGDRIAVAVHEVAPDSVGAWRLAIRSLDGGNEREVAAAGNVASPEWMPGGGAIVATVMHEGFAEIHRCDLDDGATALTRMTGGAFSPAPSPDGTIFFMSLEPDGFAIRRLVSPAAAPPRVAAERSLVPALPPPANAPAVFTTEAVPASRSYGHGHQELGWVAGGIASPGVSVTEIGARSGDVVGRFDAVAIAAFGSVRGASIAAAWRGWPVEVSAHLYHADEKMRAGDARRAQTGIELRSTWQALYDTRQSSIEAGALVRDKRSLGFASIAERFVQRSRSEEVSVAAEAGRATHLRLRGRVAQKVGPVRLGIEGERDTISGGDDRGIELGGAASSILPLSAVADRVLDPGLAPGTAVGDHYSGVRFELNAGFVTLFHQRHDLGSVVNVNGVNVAFRTPPVPLVKAPAMSLEAGAARVLGRNRFWITMRVAP